MKTIKKTFPVLNMTCASCAARVQKTLGKQLGVINAMVNYANASVQIEFDPKLSDTQKLKSALQKYGYDIVTDQSEDAKNSLEESQLKRQKEIKNKTIGAVVLSIPIAIIGMFFMDIPYANYISWLLATPVVAIFGKQFFINAWRQTRQGTANMDTLVALSTGVAYLFSVFNTVYPVFWLERGLIPHVYFEASAVVIAFILLGKLLEEKAKGNTSTALRKLIGLQPNSCTVVFNNMQKEVPISNVRVGDDILVKPGEKIAVDGTVKSGNSFVDESMISGEPIPVEKMMNEKVFAGTINQKGSFIFTAEKVGNDTLIAHIIKMVQEAQGSRAPVQKLVDKIAGVFVPVVIVIAILSMATWLIFGGENSFSHGLLAMVTVLVIACPCALGLATPTAIMVGIGRGAENGILIKDAESLEIAKNVTAIVLDKTGTLTEGKPVVTDIFWLNHNDTTPPILSAIERNSEHPLADAVVNFLGIARSVSVINFESLTGRGAKAEVDGKQYFIGNEKLLSENDINIDQKVKSSADKWLSEAKTVIYFASGSEVLAVISISDKIKPSSIEAVKNLQEAGIEVYMLTGDNKTTAKAIAEQAGILHFKGEVLPYDKSDFVKSLQAKGKIVGMVGDGINDSSALAQADISIAMGTGSDIAMDVAKMTIISSDLTKILQAIKLSKATVATIKQNLFWAFIYNIIGIPIAAGILYPINGFLLEPMIAGAAMALSSVSVVSNSLRLKMKG